MRSDEVTLSIFRMSCTERICRIRRRTSVGRSMKCMVASRKEGTLFHVFTVVLLICSSSRVTDLTDDHHKLDGRLFLFLWTHQDEKRHTC